MRQFHVRKDASVTDLKITERHHSHSQSGWGKWDQEKGPKQASPLTRESKRRRRKQTRGEIVRFEEVSFELGVKARQRRGSAKIEG